jgi:hypothetical protein
MLLYTYSEVYLNAVYDCYNSSFINISTCIHALNVQVYSYDQLVQEVIAQKLSSVTSTSKDGGESQSEVEVLELTRSTLKRLQLPRVLSAIEEQAAHARYACNRQK